MELEIVDKRVHLAASLEEWRLLFRMIVLSVEHLSTGDLTAAECRRAILLFRSIKAELERERALRNGH